MSFWGKNMEGEGKKEKCKRKRKKEERFWEN
jgi:hypothetical protein